jgi:hypothetical protein
METYVRERVWPMLFKPGHIEPGITWSRLVATHKTRARIDYDASVDAGHGADGAGFGGPAAGDAW